MRGIYAITNTLTDTVYYGQSKNINKRLVEHERDLKQSDHPNEYLQHSWNKYGKAAFVFAPIQLIEDVNTNMTPSEKHCVEAAYALGLNTFNICDPAKSPMEGRKHSEKTRKKMSISRQGKKPNLGKKFSKEHIESLRTSHKGVNVGNKNPFFGKKHTQEVRNKITIALKGNKHAQR